jgi:3'-phosphoadenosine 5'-phosphosulfate sulfotransferase (PAPS reductase)/FAD synthetase
MSITRHWQSLGTGHKFRIPDKKCELADPKNEKLVVAFSGGRTSGMMLRYILDTEEQQPLVLFANTGRERDETLDFVHNVEKQWDCPVVWLQLTLAPPDISFIKCIPSERTRVSYAKSKLVFWYEQVDYTSACRHKDSDSPFDKVIANRAILPNAVSRYCSSEMKVRTMQRYLWHNGIYRFRNAIGFRSDEPDRAYDLIYSSDRNKDCHLEFPLMRMGMTKEDVDLFWKQQNFDLGIQSYEGNCHLCFLKKRRSLLRLIHEKPELAEWWRQIEEQKGKTTKTPQGGQFNRNFSIQDLVEESFFYEPESEDTVDAMQCACNTSMSLSDASEEI